MSFDLVRIGNKDRPATPEDIKDARKQIKAVLADPELSMVTHHAFDVLKVNPRPDCATVYKVGSNDFPATEEDIQDLQEELAAAQAEKRPAVTGHAVEVTYLKIKP